MNIRNFCIIAHIDHPPSLLPLDVLGVGATAGREDFASP